MKREIDGTTLTITPEKDLIRSSVAEQLSALQDLCSEAGSVETVVLSVRQVEAIDSDGVNLLVGVWKSCMAAGHTFHVADCPEAIQRLLSIYGLAGPFGLEL